MTSPGERDHLTSMGWHDEGIGWYACAQGSSTGDWVGALNIASKVDQLIAVEARGTRATVSFHVKQNGTWKELLSTSDGWVGASGIGPAREGVDYTPQGVMYPTEAFGIKPNPGCPMGYLQVNNSHYWCGDSESPFYNLMVSVWDTDDFSEYESEHIISCGATYNFCLNMGWNVARTPYGGSAFFLHCSQGKPTQGCVTVPEPTMVQILRTVKPGCAIVIGTPSGIMRY